MITMSWPDYLRSHCKLDGRPVRLSPMQTKLLSTLLMRRPEPLPIEELIQTIYPDPDREPDNPKDIIHQEIVNLRRKLGPDAVISRRGLGYIAGQ